MKNQRHRIPLNALAVTLATILPVGCTLLPPPKPDTTRYYILDATAPAAARAGTTLVINLTEATIPDYLNRDQIVTRTTPNRIVFDEEHLWAEPLQKRVPSVLAKNLQRAAGSNHIDWDHPDTGKGAIPVRIEILQLDGNFGKGITLRAAWSVSSSKNAAHFRIDKEHADTVPLAEDATYDDYANGINQLLAQLAQLVAKDILETKAREHSTTNAP
ncbi:MAG: PqiC family protein [Puniceicoccales bacterium]|jgi:uncharacterized lipoprotein YmbA|nr:PqiC family protein [Puniceicoccales bacterium]